MKKISIIALHLGFGGAEQCICNLANNLINDYEVEIISVYKLYDQPAFKLNKNIKITYLIENHKPNKDKWLNALKKLKLIPFIKESYNSVITLFLKKHNTIKAIKNCQSNIIISSKFLFNKWVGKYASKEIYKIAWEHNHYHGNIKYAKNVINSCKNMDKLILVSNSLKDFYSSKMKEMNYLCECVYIPNMLDFEVKEKSNLKGNRIVSIGRLSPEKGMSDLIDIFNIFHKKHQKWHLDIIGDGSLKQSLQEKINKENLNNCITLHGFLSRTDINKILKKSSIYLMTSFTESFGLVLIEAMAFGLPCISFDSAEGANDIIENNKYGFLISDRDFNKMVEKIELLAQNKSKKILMGNQAYKTSLNYTNKKVIMEWLKILS